MIGHGFKVKKHIVSDDVDEVPRVEFVEGDFSVTETGAPEVPVCVQLLDNPSAVIIAFINSFDETATGEVYSQTFQYRITLRFLVNLSHYNIGVHYNGLQQVKYIPKLI